MNDSSRTARQLDESPLDFADPPAFPTSWRFFTVLFIAALLLLTSLVTAVLAVPPWSWLLALLFLPYESLLTMHLLYRSLQPEARPKSMALTELSEKPPAMALLIAARNERAALPATLASLADQVVDGDEILIIDDGSTDGTAAWLAQEYGLTSETPVARGVRWPALRLLRLERNGGKAAALNAGLASTKVPVVVCLDADTMVKPGSLAALRHAFAAEPALAVACGVVVPTCQPGGLSRYFQAFQRLEYRRSYVWRLGWMADRTLVLVPGAFAAFRRETLAAVAGFNPASRVEDYEVMFRLHRQAMERSGPLLVRVVPGAVAITDAPSTVPMFIRQRRRWFAGFITTMFQHRDLVANPRAGRLGMVHLVLKTVDMLLPLFGLLGLAMLVTLVVMGWSIPPFILGLMLGKVVLDLPLHIVVERMYWHRLGGGRQGHPGNYALLLADPLLFQPLRQCGACAGILAYLRGSIDWTPQRPWNHPASSMATSSGS